MSAASGKGGMGSLANLVVAVGILAVVVGLFLRAGDDPEARFADLEPAAPQRLQVKALGIDAPVVPIQVDQDAVLDPPRNAEDVGWWDASAQPGGDDGQTVITGHTVHTGGGALDRLREVSRGDRVDVVTEEGRMRYRVQQVRVLGKDEVARDAVDLFGQDDGSGRLVLVSCTDWDGTVYESNVVVTAMPLGQPVAPSRERAARADGR
jgi:LPXTG-site transpeptidase (sortase) family protein